MTVEVENDLYINENLLENTTALIPEEQESMENVRQECLEKEMELVQWIEAFRRRAQNWSEDLRLTMRGRPVPLPADLRNRNIDLRKTLRRRSGPTDLRNSKLNRDKDLRDMMRPRRRTSSVPPDPRTLREALSTEKAIDYLERTIIKREKFLDTGTDERRQLIRRLKTSMAGHKERVEEESDTSNSSDSNEEGEVEPSEDELINVRYSESDTSIRTPKPGPSEDELKGDLKSRPDNQTKRRRLTKRDQQQQIRNPKPGTSGTRWSGPPATPKKINIKKSKKFISTIKFPVNSPIKKNDEESLSKLTPRTTKPSAIMDARERLDAVPASMEPKIDSGRGPMESRVNCEFPPCLKNDKPNVPAFLPWKPGHAPMNNPWLPATSSHMKWGTAHRSRSFIEGKTTSRNDSTMTGQEDEAPGVNKDEEEDTTPNVRPTPFWWDREEGQTDNENEEEEDGFNDPGREDAKRNK